MGTELSGKTVKHALAILKTVLIAAVEWAVLEKLPTWPKVRVDGDAGLDFYNVPETERLLAGARDDQERLWLLFALHTGASFGPPRATATATHPGETDMTTTKTSNASAIMAGQAADARARGDHETAAAIEDLLRQAHNGARKGRLAQLVGVKPWDPSEDTFVHAIVAAMKRASLADILNAGEEAPVKRGPGRPKAATDDDVSCLPTEIKRVSPDGMQRRLSLIVSYVTSHPGTNGQTARAALGFPREKWLLRVAKAVQAGMLRKEGQKRATMYWAV